MSDLTLLTAIHTDPDAATEALQARGRESLAFFCRELLGFTDMNAEHEALCEYLQHDPAPVRLILMPRGTFKSSISTIGDTLWLLANEPNERVLLYSDATEKAEGFLTGIKHHIQGAIQGSLFRAVYKDWTVDPKRGVWNQGAITIAERTSAAIEPSIETAGVETSKTGKHYNRIKFDDLVTDKNVTTRELMDKVIDVYKNADSLLLRSGRKDLIGTRWDYGDLYGWLKATFAGDPGFSMFHRAGHDVDRTRYYFQEIGKESLTPAMCDRKRREWGSYKYSCLIQNEPVDPDTALFKPTDFRFYDPAHLPTGLYITACLDPIPPHERGAQGDDAALTIVGTDADLTLYVLDIVAGRLQPSDQIEALFTMHRKWGIRNFGVETNAFQKTMRRDIDIRYKEERLRNSRFRFFQVTEFNGTSLPNKRIRIRGLQPYHERGALRFPGTSLDTLSGHYRTLAWQLIQEPKSPKDDLADSLAGHIQLYQAGETTEVVRDIPYTSAAWFEREEQQEAIHVMARRPRWTRTRVPELSFS